MDNNCDNKILRDEALKRVKKENILHSSGLGEYNGLASGGSSMTYQQRQEMNRKYVAKYDDSQIGQVRNPLARAQAVQPQGKKKHSRFDAQIRRRG